MAAPRPATTVLSSLALKGVLEASRSAFESALGPLELGFDATRSILERLAQGARADLLILTSDALEALRRKGEVTQVRALGSSGVGLAVRAGAAKPDIGSTEALVRALLSANSVAHSKVGASGIYFSELLERLGIAGKLKKAHRGGERPSGTRGGGRRGANRSAAALRACARPGIDIVSPFPEPLQKLTHFSAGVSAHATRPEQAKALMILLTSEASRAAMLAGGMQPALS
jgi:molybdate transport system substrate-binding protein